MKSLLIGLFLAILTAPVMAASETQNFDPSHLPHFRKCLAAVRSGGVHCRMLIVGDSTSAVDKIGGPDAKSYAWPALLAPLLAAKTKLPVDFDTLMGNSNTPSNVKTDARITSYSGNWFDNTDMQSLGGDWFSNSASKESGSFAFTPLSQVDSFKVWYITSPQAGRMDIRIDKDAALTISTHSLTKGVGSQVVTTIPGSHSLSVTNTSGGTEAIHVIGIEAWDSKNPGISIMNAAWSGSDAMRWTKSPAGVSAWNPANMIAAIAPDITLIDLNVNDAARENNIHDYRKNLEFIISQAQKSGDVVLVTSHHGTKLYDDAHLHPYIDVVYSLAGKHIPVVDNWVREVSYEAESGKGWMFDSVHMYRQGYADFALGVANALGAF